MLSWFSILFRGLWLSAWRSPYKDLRKCDTSIASPALLRFSRRDLAWLTFFRRRLTASCSRLLASHQTFVRLASLTDSLASLFTLSLGFCNPCFSAFCSSNYARFASSPRCSGRETFAPRLLAPLATARSAFRLPTPCSLHLTMKLASCRFGLAAPRRYAIPFLELAALRAL